MANGTWSVFKSCPVNADNNGAWYFFEENGQFIEQY